MSNLRVLDAVGADKYLRASGAGTDGDPHVPEHLESNSADILTAAQAIQAAVETLDNIVSGAEAQVDIVSAQCRIDGQSARHSNGRPGGNGDGVGQPAHGVADEGRPSETQPVRRN